MTTFRTATLEDLSHVLQWAADEGWNPGLDDARAFHTADPDGFFVAESPGGALLGAISVVNHSEAFSFLGLYLVVPEMRGQGIGYGLWTHALAHAEHRTIGLDGVEAQQQNYAASGFVHAGGTTRFEGKLPSAADRDISSATADELPLLIALEAAASGVEKPVYLSAWFTDTASRRTLVARDATGITGLCTVRQCQNGVKVGPLVAASDAVARRLLGHSASLFDGPFTIDVPESEPALAGICKAYGLTSGFKTARMYRGPAPTRPPFGGLYAVGTLELG